MHAERNKEKRGERKMKTCAVPNSRIARMSATKVARRIFSKVVIPSLDFATGYNKTAFQNHNLPCRYEYDMLG